MVFASSAVAADIVLVVNKSNPVSSLSAQDAKMIYLGNKKSWDNGEKITLYSQYDYAVREDFTGKVLNKTGQQFATYWKKALFTGTGRPPIEVKDDAEMKKFIAIDPRGIGYISSTALDDSVKALVIH
jgi:ABC-type phosphate transport system substrate-binding protein